MNIHKHFTAAILFCACISALQAQTEFARKTDSLLNYLYLNNRFSGTLLIAKSGNILYQRDFNANQQENNEYMIGSQSKMFTAVIIYQLVQEHVLSLNDKLSKYYPKIPNADNITLYQMLCHESGIHDLINDDGFSNIQYDTLTENAIADYIAALKPAFDPGKDADYSNSNYILLGMIAEMVTGKSLTELLQTRIIGPLQLKDTYNLTLQTSGSKLNPCYTFNGNSWQPVEQLTNPTLTAGAGSVISSVFDMQKFIEGLFHDQLIDSVMLDSMMQLGSHSKAMAHGLFLAPFYEHQGYGHTGHVDEFYSATFYMPDDSLTLSFCSNGLNYDMNQIMIGVLSYYFNTDYTFPELGLVHLSDQELQVFAGDYRLKLFHLIPVIKIEVTAENGALFTGPKKSFDTDKAIVEPVGPHTFKNFTYASELDFLYKHNGKIKGCELHQGKNTLYCRRLN